MSTDGRCIVARVQQRKANECGQYYSGQDVMMNETNWLNLHLISFTSLSGIKADFSPPFANFFPPLSPSRFHSAFLTGPTSLRLSC